MLWAPAAARCQDAAAVPPPWKASAELSYVATGGNADTRALGLKAHGERHWGERTLRLELSTVQSEAAEGGRVAVGSPENVVEPERRAQAERYLADAAWEHRLGERLYWSLGSLWERNRPAGLDSRLLGRAGLGWEQGSDEAGRRRAALFGTWTRRSEVVGRAGGGDAATTYAGLRLELGLEQPFGVADHRFAAALAVDQALEDSDPDPRQEEERLVARLVSSLRLAMTQRLALQAGVELAYDDDPAYEEIPCLGCAGTATALHQLDELDTLVTLALVVRLEGGA